MFRRFILEPEKFACANSSIKLAHLDISVQYALRVEVPDALEDLPAHSGYEGLLHHGLGHHVGEGAAGHVLHDDKQVHALQEGLGGEK